MMEPDPRNELRAFAIDHRAQFEAMTERLGVPRAGITPFKVLALEATLRVAKGRPGYGMLLDGTYGHEALTRAAGHLLWIGRPVERPGSRPLEFDIGLDGPLATHLAGWSKAEIVKVLCFYHPDDLMELKTQQEGALQRVAEAARATNRACLIEIIAGNHGLLDDETIPNALERLYALGLKPDWWKLEPQASASAWAKIDAVIARNDPDCQGIIMLGLEAPIEALQTAFRAALAARHVKGFAVGRTLWARAAEQWFKGEIGDEEAITLMAERFSTLCAAWDGRKA